MSGERNDMKRHGIGYVLLIFGVLLLFGAIGLTAYNIWDGVRATEASQSIRNQLVRKIQENGEEKVEEKVEVSDPDDVPEMPTEEIGGYHYIGTIEVPDTGIFLPVMAEWDNDRLKISPCRYAGSYYTDDMVICAHNYSKHFSSIKWLDLGAEIDFTNVNRKLFRYTVSSIETVQPTEVEQMVSNSNNSEGNQNDWDLTLFTCSTGGRVRYAVRCVRVKE